MPAIPDFQPATQSGQGFAQSQSLMQRASANRRAEEMAEMERQKFEIMRPVLESQARVQLVSEANDLTAAHIVNNSIASDLQRFPDFVKAWTDSAVIEDPKERLNERRRILGAITPFAAIKSTAPMVKAFQEQYAQDANADKTADVLAGRVEVAGAQNDAKAAKTAADNEVKMALKQKDIEIAQMKAEHAAALREAQLGAREREVEAKIKSNEGIAAGRAAGAASRPKEAAARKANDAIVLQVGRATEELPKMLRALDILEDPETRTGTAAGLEIAARRMGEALGVDIGKVGDMEELQSTLGSTFLNYVGQMKGAISDKETQALMSMSPGVGKTAAGNIALVSNIVKTLARNIALGQIVLQGRESEAPVEAEIQNEVLRTMIETPMESFMPARERKSAAGTGLTPQEQTRLQELRSKLGK